MVGGHGEVGAGVGVNGAVAALGALARVGDDSEAADSELLDDSEEVVGEAEGHGALADPWRRMRWTSESAWMACWDCDSSPMACWERSKASCSDNRAAEAK